MSITKRQAELDRIKWFKSAELGIDACGTFDYCVMCDKALENPCDKAYQKFNKKSTEKKTAKKTCKKATATKTAKKTVKTEVAVTKVKK